MNARTLVLVGLVALAAGCLGLSPDDTGSSTPEEASPTWYQDAFPYGPDHDHEDPQHHANLTTPNFNLVGWNPLITDHHDATSGDYFCGGVGFDGDREYAIVNSFFTDVALVVIDVTDPEDPQLVGELVLPGTHVYDADITSDARWAVLGMYPPTEEDEHRTALADEDGFALTPTWRDACGNEHIGHEEILPYQSGTVLVDLSDPTNPTVADYDVQPINGPHSVFATTIDGEAYALASVPNSDQAASYYTLYSIQDAPLLGGTLTTVGTWNAQYAEIPDDRPDERLPTETGHTDGWIAEHPLTGQTLVYLANWDGGLVILDYQGPFQLVPVGTWNDYDEAEGAGMTGAWHGVLPMEETWDDRHYTIIHQEVGQSPEGRPSGMVVIVDTTDPGDPFPVARWTLPIEPPEDAWEEHLQFSTHYVAYQDETLYVTLYHGGLWAIDASQEHWPELPTRGVFVPDNQSPQPVPEGLDNYARWTPVLLDTQALGDDRVITYDISGAYIVQYDPSLDVPTPDPWHPEPWDEIPPDHRDGPPS